MSQQVKCVLHKPDDLGSIPETHIKVGEKWHHRVVLWLSHPHMHPHIYFIFKDFLFFSFLMGLERCLSAGCSLKNQVQFPASMW